MKLNRTGSNWTELERNKINENWDIIEGNHNKLEGEFNDVVGKITDEVVGHLIDSAKLIWKEPVDTVGDLTASAEVGETRMVREADPDGISYIYRYDGEKWEKIQEIDVTLVNEVDSRLTRQLAETVSHIEKQLIDRIPNLRDLGAELDGESDDYDVAMWALNKYGVVMLPAGAILATSETIQLKQGQGIIGVIPNSRGFGKTARIKYIGEKDNHKAVVIIGKNAVDAEPFNDATDIVLQNVLVDANSKAGHGVYGTYVTNETQVNNVVASNSLEYGMYFAKSWYATFRNLIAINNRGQGLAFGMPLEYLDGSKIEWTSPSNLEMNNVFIENIRSSRSGTYYSEENPQTYNPELPHVRRKAYGIGFGVGNGFNAKGFLSEGSGGANLYIYTEDQPVKSVEGGYLERPNLNSGLNPSGEMVNIIIEHTSNTGGAYELKNIFMNHNSGGIYHTGEKRKVWLKNVHQPRFLKSLDGVVSNELYSFVLKDNVHHECGTYNTDLESAVTEVLTTENVRYSWSIDLFPTDSVRLLYVKTPPGSVGASIRAINKDGSDYLNRSISDTDGEWRYFSALGRNVVEVKNGAVSQENKEVDFAILKVKNTSH